MSSPNFHDYLNSFTDYEKNLHKISLGVFDLSRVRELLDLLGNPQHNLKIIHVAGTKGKGSTCAFLAYMLAAAGMRVGLYTSPHLHKVNERIRVLDKNTIESAQDFAGMISDDEFSKVLNHLRPFIAAMINRRHGGTFLTYFEVLTVAAIYYFSQQNLDWVVLETGLGGRLDATNAVESAIAVLTPISLDHTKILGNTIELIAKEKAGIIKDSQQQVVIAPQEPEVMKVIRDRCREVKIGDSALFCSPKLANKIGRCPLFLRGAHQKLNASTACAVVELLKQGGAPISDAAIEQGLKLTRWPGRFEVLKGQPTVIVDGAHNAASAKVLVETLLEEYPKQKNVIAVIGLSADKDVQGFSKEIATIAKTVVLTKAIHPRAYIFNAQEEVFKNQEVVITDNIAAALTAAFSKAKKEDIVVVTGSLFVVAEAREQLGHYVSI